MEQPYYVVDTFTNTPFGGNPAAVVPSQKPLEEGWMRAVAAEMNLSQCAFTWPEGDGWRIRWLTPKKEISLCGAATLAAAHTLWGAGLAPKGAPLRFYSLAGRLTVAGRDGWVEMDFPANPPRQASPLPGLLEALFDGPPPAGLVEYTGQYTDRWLVVLASGEPLKALAPQMEKLAALETSGVAVSAPGQPPYDFISRYFAPRLGVAEDPVTGSAHTALAPFWGARLGKTSLHAFQASGRGGQLKIALQGERVALSGQAVLVAQGVLKA